MEFDIFPNVNLCIIVQFFYFYLLNDLFNYMQLVKTSSERFFFVFF